MLLFPAEHGFTLDVRQRFQQCGVHWYYYETETEHKERLATATKMCNRYGTCQVIKEKESWKDMLILRKGLGEKEMKCLEIC